MPRHTRRTAAAAAAAEAAAAEPEPAAKRAKTEPETQPETQPEAQPEAPVEPIALGDAIPAGEVLNQDGAPVDLAKQYSSGVLAIYAYPKASTPGCTRQTEGFGAAFGELTALGVAVFGISADSPAAQTTFRTKTGVDFDLLSDPEYRLLAPLGAKKSPKGVIRSHWVFVDGKALLVEHNVKPDASPARVVHAIKEAIKNGTDGNSVKDPETRIEPDSASGKAESAAEIAQEPVEKLDDGTPTQAAQAEDASDRTQKVDRAEAAEEKAADAAAHEPPAAATDAAEPSTETPAQPQSQDTIAADADKNGAADGEEKSAQ